MIIKDFDYLSSSITLYFSNSSSHRSLVSGILTVLHCLVLVITSTYYISIVFNKSNLTSFYFKTYIDDPGIYEINSTSFFHYLTFKDNFVYDSRAMAIIGAEINLFDVFTNKTEYDIDHWVYSECNPSKSASPSISKKVKDESGLCITEFYNSSSRKFYKLNEEGYKSPTIQHGVGNYNGIPYGIFFKHCKNTTKENRCYSKEGIYQVYEKLTSVTMNVLDPYVDVENYKNPFIENINSYNVGIVKDYIRVSHSYFNPARIKTNTGILFNTYDYQTSYSFTQEVRGSYETNNTEIEAMFFFWMYNHIDSYDRKYLQLIDILAIVSGIFKLSWIIFFGTNILINEYISHRDFENFLVEKISKRKNQVQKITSRNENELPPIKNNFMTKKEELAIKRKKTHRNFKKITFLQMFRFFFRIGDNLYLSFLSKLRRKIISEEKMIMNYLKIKKMNGLWISMGNKNEKSSKTLGLVNLLYNKNYWKTFESSMNKSSKNNVSTLELLQTGYHI